MLEEAARILLRCSVNKDSPPHTPRRSRQSILLWHREHRGGQPGVIVRSILCLIMRFHARSPKRTQQKC